MSLKGGARPGAGRKKGQRNNMTVQQVEAARSTGELPHEFLLRVARGEEINHYDRIIQPDFDTRISCAQAAAPYFAPKLAQIEQKIESNVQYAIGSDPLTEEEFEFKYNLGVESPAETEDLTGL